MKLQTLGTFLLTSGPVQATAGKATALNRPRLTAPVTVKSVIARRGHWRATARSIGSCVASAFVQRRRVMRDRYVLSQFNDHLLRDIGLGRNRTDHRTTPHHRWH